MIRTLPASDRRGIAHATLTALAVAAALLAPAVQAEATTTCVPHTTGVCRAASPHPAGATAECKDGTRGEVPRHLQPPWRRPLLVQVGHVLLWVAPALPPGATSLQEPNRPVCNGDSPRTFLNVL